MAITLALAVPSRGAFASPAALAGLAAFAGLPSFAFRVLGFEAAAIVLGFVALRYL